MMKVRQFVSAFLILSHFSPTELLLEGIEIKLENISAAGESQLKCTTLNSANARRFCDPIPAHSLLGHINVTLIHRNTDFKGKLVKEKVTKRSYFIDADKYLPEVNRKTIQQILNSCWREQILDSHYASGTLVFTLPRLKSTIYVLHVNLNSLSRFNGYKSVLFVQSRPIRHKQIITDPAQLLDILKEELTSINPESFGKLHHELNSHTLNALLANWQKHEIHANLGNQQIFHRFIPKEISDYSHQFEKLITNGHPYYPLGKSKVGFSVQDILNYSPEFQPRILLMLAAVHKSAASIATINEDFDYKSWFARHFSEEWNHWTVALSAKGMRGEDYIPLPIHPWQVTHHLERTFADLIRNRILVPLKASIEATPTSSIRTMLPTRNPNAPYIKIPVSVHATSCMRTYPSDIVKTAPVLSSLMAQILANESSIAQKLNIMREDIGIYLNTIEEERAQHLTVTFRENVVSCCLRGQEIAVVVLALFDKVPATNCSLFIHIMEFAGCTAVKGAVQYFTNYVDLVMGSYLDLYLVYGIALEGHQQNTLAIFENGSIKRFVAKDLTGLMISADLSNSFPILANISLSSYFKKYDEFHVRNLLLHTVYQMHLGELLLLVADHFGCSEKLLWNVVRDKTKERFEVLKERMDGVRWRNEYDAILKANWSGRSFLQNRFENDYVENDLHHFIKNPLN